MLKRNNYEFLFLRFSEDDFFIINLEEEDNDKEGFISLHFYITILPEFRDLLKKYNIAVILGIDGWHINKRHQLKQLK